MALAAPASSRVLLATIDQDHDGTLYSSWETVEAYGKAPDPGGHRVEPIDWEPPED